ncbi:MAG: thioredoxin-like domain-containing protein [Lysobacteraceae bacterium]
MDTAIAPELPHTLEWLNLPTPLRLGALRGRVCLLAFVNLGSAWSQQRLRDLAQLQARHGDRLQVVAVHAPRFEHERDARRAHRRLGLQALNFPVAHDADWAAWQHFGVEAWPTVLLLDGDGQLRGRFVGASGVHELEARAMALLEGLETPDPGEAPILRRASEPAMPLRHPTGLAVNPGYLYVADSGHHRVLECDHAGRVLRQFGSGGADLLDGPAELAAFDRPHGLCLLRGALYVADSGNHAVRRIDLRSGEVATVLGCGRPGVPEPGAIADPRAVPLDQPRAVALAGETLLVACTGDNRVWRYHLGRHVLSLAAGSGALAVRDGAGEEAAFAEPVALAAVQQRVYVCDGAGSAIRMLDERTGQVTTLVGLDAWQHGRADGARHDARLQDPQAIALDPEAPVLWIADAGNDLLRTLRLGGGELATWALPQRLHNPGGIAVAEGAVWIADTDAHAVLRLDTRSGALQRVPVGE